MSFTGSSVIMRELNRSNDYISHYMVAFNRVLTIDIVLLSTPSKCDL